MLHQQVELRLIYLTPSDSWKHCKYPINLFSVHVHTRMHCCCRVNLSFWPWGLFESFMPRNPPHHWGWSNVLQVCKIPGLIGSQILDLSTPWTNSTTSLDRKSDGFEKLGTLSIQVMMFKSSSLVSFFLITKSKCSRWICTGWSTLELLHCGWKWPTFSQRWIWQKDAMQRLWQDLPGRRLQSCGALPKKTK